MKPIMTNMTQPALPDAINGVKSTLTIKLKTTGEKERIGARIEAVMHNGSKVDSIFMYNAQYGYQSHSNGCDAHWYYTPTYNSEHWKPEIFVTVTPRGLPADGSVVELGTFTYYSPEGVPGVSTPLRVRAPFDPRVELNMREALLASWEDYASKRRVYSHKISLDLPDENVSYWRVSFTVAPGTSLFKKPWTACTHNEDTGEIELTWSAADRKTSSERREIDFQLLSSSINYNPALAKLNTLQGHYIIG